MANYLKFDGAGHVIFPQAVAAGDFTVEILLAQMVRTGTNIGILAGNNAATSDFIAYTNQLRLTARVAGSGLDSGLQAVAEGSFVKVRLQRVGNTTTIYSNDVALNSTVSLTGAFTLSSFGSYNNGTLKYSGEMYGYISLVGFAGGDRLYDIANSTGTTLVDTISGQNGTLSGFTTGGLLEAVDTTPPVITLLGDNPLTVTQGQAYVEPGFTATDDTDGNITANVIVSGSVDTNVIGQYTLNYNVSDAAGNAAVQRTRTIDVVAEANDAPVITLIGANPLTLIQGTPYVEPGFTATDAQDGNITGSVIVTGTIDENTISSQQLTYNVTDAGGLTDQKIRTVNVVAAAELVNLTSPTSFQCKQRTAGGEALFTMTGTYSTAQIFEYSIDGGATFTDINTVAATSFNEDFNVVGQVDLIVRVKDTPGSAVTVEKLTSAMCICIAPAQSNGSGRLVNNQTYTLNPGAPTPMMYKNGVFSVMTDPTGEEAISLGSIWPSLSELFVNAGVPVCINNIGVGGSSITMWQPGSSRHNNIIEFADAVGGLEILASLIGETDAQNSMSTADFKSNYLSSVTPINTAYGCDVRAIYFPVGSSLNANPSRVAAIRLAYDELIAENAFIKNGGDLAEITIVDSIHITTDTEGDQAASIIYSAITGTVPVVTSTLSMTLQNIPDGANPTRIIDPAGAGAVVFLGDITWTSDTASYVVEVPPGTTLEYYAIGLTEGGLNRGVTA